LSLSGISLTLLRRRGLLSAERIELLLSWSLCRLHFTPGSHDLVYARRGGHDGLEPTEGERIDPMDFVADRRRH